MNPTLNLLIALLLFPGVVSALVITLLVAKIAGVHAPGGGLSRGILATLRGQGSFLLLFGALAPLVAAGFLAWSGSPLPNPRPSHLWTVWVLLEMSYFAALLPSLQHLSSTGVRSAMREMQLTALGRFMVWAGIVIAWSAGRWAIQTMPAHILALATVLIALPVAAGWGAFVPDTSLSPAGAEIDFSLTNAQLAQWGRIIRTSVLITVIAVLMLPKLPNVHWAINSLITLAVIILIALIGRTMNGSTVRRTLPDALQWCLNRAVPLAVLAVIALWLGKRWL